MNDTWKTFLLRQGAVYQNGWPEHFGNPQVERRSARDRDVIVDLSSLSLIRVRGQDAKGFLNGQLTNELETLDSNQHRLAAWCTAQGRMLVVFRVFLREGDYYLQLPAPMRDDMIKRLRMFILRSKVTVESADADLVRFGLCGPATKALLQEAVGIVPESDGVCVSSGSTTILRLAGLHPRFEVIAPLADAMAIWETPGHKPLPAGSGIWVWHDIMAGIPVVLPETKEAFVPQMANLELVGGVHFKKGCYPGQEIVARMQYLGRLKQRMVRAHVNADAPAPGASIFAPDMRGQAAGTVVCAQPSPDVGSDLLAVIQLSSLQQGELHLGDEVGPLLTIHPLPYSVNREQ